MGLEQDGANSCTCDGETPQKGGAVVVWGVDVLLFTGVDVTDVDVDSAVWS